MVADEATIATFEEAGFLCFEDMARAVHALGALARFRRAFAREPIRPDSSPPMRVELPASGFLGEFESKAVLRAAGLPVPHDVLATSAEEAARAAHAAAVPVVLKIASQDIPHKTEVGGVLLGIRGEEAARTAFGTLMERARCHAPTARIDGVLVTPMAPTGVETILGVTQDAAFGPVLMFGMGGTLAECLRDTTFRVAPIDRREAQVMIAETRASALLGGWRGAAPADTDALVEALVNLSRLAVEQRGRIHSVEVNPFRVLPRGSGALALDALVVRAHQGGQVQEPGP
jgi:acyl-CoA synthetase (NDP forming)